MELTSLTLRIMPPWYFFQELLPLLITGKIKCNDTNEHLRFQRRGRARLCVLLNTPNSSFFYCLIFHCGFHFTSPFSILERWNTLNAPDFQQRGRAMYVFYWTHQILVLRSSISFRLFQRETSVFVTIFKIESSSIR